MSANLYFYPLGNADSSLIRLENDQLILIDYANMCDDGNTDDLRCNLPVELRRILSETGKEDFDVVCFTHLDNDHVKRASDFFWFESLKETQKSGRPKIKELWVPACAVTEVGCEEESRRVRQEARTRLLAGEGIKVFARPKMLEEFLTTHGLSVEERRHCIVNAGELVPGFSLENESKAEFFVHSPFAWRINNREVEDRNQDSVVLHVTLRTEHNDSRLIFGGDVDAETLSKIVLTSERHDRHDRLQWDLLHLFHHCSWKSLSTEKPVDAVSPQEDVQRLLEVYGGNNAIIVSPSKPIPHPGSKEDFDPQPPHRLAANYYKELVLSKSGHFLVTMEYPNELEPKPLCFEVSKYGITRKAAIAQSSTLTVATTNQRAG